MDIDAIGPLGPQPPPKGEKIETGRYPVLIEGKIVIEYEADFATPHRVYSYAKPETGDEDEAIGIR